MSNSITRRQFAAGAVVAGATAAVARRSALGAFAANEQVHLGFIGVGNRANFLIDTMFSRHADARITAICDVYEPYVELTKKKVGGDPFTTKDYRWLLDRKDIDAVVIATPDHWHALQFIDACAAGKDVYVEKPLSLVIAEGRKMVEAATHHKRITQMGVFRRSSSTCQHMVDLIRGGAIGKVSAVRCFFIANESPMGIGKPADSEPPTGLDWDMWLGPAPKVPYNENRCLYKFRWFRAYSGGQVTNQATHWTDLIQWAIGQDAPTGVFAIGNRIGVDDNREIPVNMEAIWQYPDGTLVTYSQFNANSAPGDPKKSYIEFRGTEGTLYFNGNVSISPEVIRQESLPALNPLDPKEVARRTAATTKPAGRPPIPTHRHGPSDHARNFLDCVKSRKPCTCPVEVGHRSTSTTLLANIALDRQRYLTWDPQAERVTNDPDANKLLSYEYRAPWKLA